jgi:type IX secretion system PorP/SprF family membrane protein
MKRIVSILCFLCVTISMKAQQIPQYSQYMRNQFMLNPGAAGVYDFMDLTLSGRWQWIGFGNEPRTAFLSGSTVLGKKNRQPYNPAFRISQGIVRNPEIKTGKLKHAVGGQLLTDQYGAFRKMNFAGTYAIHIPVSQNYNLSFGTRLGLTNNTFLQDKAVALNPNDPFAAYGGGDQEYDAFVANNSNKFIMDIGAGFYLYSKKMFFGVAADHLSKDFVEFGSGTVNFNTQIHFNATAGIKLPINDDLTLIPSILVKNMRPAPFSLEGSLLAEYKEWLWMGVSYRNSDAVIGMFGFNVSETFKFGYSYDFSVSRMNQVSSGGHELVLGIMLR